MSEWSLVRRGKQRHAAEDDGRFDPTATMEYLRGDTRLGQGGSSTLHHQWLFLIALVALLASGCREPRTEGRTVTTDRSADTCAALQYYCAHGAITDPGIYTHLYEGLPDDVPGLVAAVQGALISTDALSLYGLPPLDESDPVQSLRAGSGIRRVEKMLEAIQQLDRRPISVSRQPEKRLVVCCRQFAVMLCSVLRHKRIPARARGGFETFFSPERHHDHWICEYWSAQERRWVQVDAEMEDVLRRQWGVKFDPLDLPAGTFMTGGEAWRLYRTRQLRADQCGVMGEEWVGGFGFILAEVVLDLMALNKQELLPWDGNALSRTGEAELSAEQYTLLDHVAHLSAAPDKHFAELRSVYEGTPALQMPPDWAP